MPTRHILQCPNCLHELLIDVEGAIGGVVQDNLVLVDHRPTDGSPLVTTLVEPGTVGVGPAGVPGATPAAVVAAEAKGVDLADVTGTGRDVEVPASGTETVSTITQADVNKAAANPAPVDAPAATPAATAHADDLGVDLADVAGTGSGGTITKADVTDHVASEPS